MKKIVSKIVEDGLENIVDEVFINFAENIRIIFQRDLPGLVSSSKVDGHDKLFYLFHGYNRRISQIVFESKTDDLNYDKIVANLVDGYNSLRKNVNV